MLGNAVSAGKWAGPPTWPKKDDTLFYTLPKGTTVEWVVKYQTTGQRFLLKPVRKTSDIPQKFEVSYKKLCDQFKFRGTLSPFAEEFIPKSGAAQAHSSRARASSQPQRNWTSGGGPP